MQMKRVLASVIAVLFVLQLLPQSFVTALGPGTKLTDEYVVIHDPDASDNPSSLEITTAGGTPIQPNENGNYDDVPADAKISLKVAFHLEDGDEENGVYEYQGGEYFTMELPEGITFERTSGDIPATDSETGSSYTLANWSISGRTLRVELTEDVKDKWEKWGEIQIDGTFGALSEGDGLATKIEFGSKTIIINRKPLPPAQATLAKTHGYDASTNEIMWTITVTPPASAPDLSGYTLHDTFGAGQKYAAGFFTVGGVSVEDSALNLTGADGGSFAYTFPNGTSGEQTVTYRTEVTNFANDTTFANEAVLKRDDEEASNTVKDDVTLNWMKKSGEMAATTDDPTIVKWTVKVTIPGEEGKAVSGAVIKDQLADVLELYDEPGYPVQIQLGSGTAENVNKGSGEGTYSYNDNTFVYSFLDGKPEAGEDATLTFYTRVKPDRRDEYLNDNSTISFSNTATLNWNGNTTEQPSSTTTSSKGIGEGGILSKSGGSSSQYAYSETDPGTIHWTITVNRNRISIKNATITDTIPAGQELLIDDEHPLTVKKGTGTPETILSKANSGDFTYVNAQEFSYALGNIKEACTITYSTLVTNVSTLYANGNVNFGNSVKLTRDGGVEVTTPGTKTYQSQMLSKSVARDYDTNDKLVQWQLVVNRNKLPLTGATVTDKLPEGMKLFIDGEHPFTVLKQDQTEPMHKYTSIPSSGSLTVPSDEGSFAYALPSPATEQYTITYWTQMQESALKDQWTGSKNFTNGAELTADEITSSITDKATVRVSNPVITKKHTYQPGDTHVDWEAVINPGRVHLTKGVIKDTLQPVLELDSGSVKLYEVSVDKDGKPIDATKNLLSQDAYTIDLPSDTNSNTLLVHLPANTDKAYLLTFTTVILTENVEIKNSIGLEGETGDATGTGSATAFRVGNVYADGGSGSNGLTVKKVDEDGNPLKGAAFRLLMPNKTPMKRSGQEITQSTQANGIAEFANLPAWAFYVEEITPPEGYLLSTEPVGGKRLNTSEPVEYTITNAPAVGSISFDKISTKAGKPLNGGSFTLTGTDYAGREVSLAARAENGTVTFTNVPLNREGETYTIRETVAPSGYRRSTVELTASVRYNTDKTGVVTSISAPSLENTPLPPSPTSPPPVEGSIRINKTDDGGRKLSGATFKLYSKGDDTLIAAAVSDENGLALFENVPEGSYVLRETEAPKGYAPSGKSIEVDVTTNEALSYTVVNKKLETQPGSVRITKTDAEGQPLSGAEFTLYDAAGKAVASAVSGADGLVVWEKVPAGAYTLSETRVPDGYAAAADSSVTVASGKESSLTVVNRKKTDADVGALHIHKVDQDGKPLSGAAFTLYGADGTVIATGFSGADGMARFSDLPVGAVTVRETAAPHGYKRFDEPLTVQIAADGVHAYTLENVSEDAEGPSKGWLNASATLPKPVYPVRFM